MIKTRNGNGIEKDCNSCWGRVWESNLLFLTASTPLVVFEKNGRNKIIRANLLFSSLVGDDYSKTGCFFDNIIIPENENKNLYRDFLERSSKEIEEKTVARFRILAKGKNSLPVEISAQEISWDGKRVISAAIRDITQEQNLYKRLSHDELTGLPTRHLFFDQLEMLIKQRGENWLVVLFMDLDNFKPINDEYGHVLGDQVLKEIASRLRDNLRSEDLICRLGGDEFVVAFKIDDTDVDPLFLTDSELCIRNIITEKVENISKSVGQPIIINNRNGEERIVEISASIGMTYRLHQDILTQKTKIESLLEEADDAMYIAKSEDSGSSFYKKF